MMSQLAHVICAFCRVTCLVLDPGPTIGQVVAAPTLQF